VLLPQHCTTYNDVFLLIILQKCNFRQAQYKLPEDGPGGLKYLGEEVGNFIVNFNILYVQ